MVVDKPAGVVVHPGRSGHGPARSARHSPGGRPAARIMAPGSSIGWIGTLGTARVAKSDAVHRALKDLIAKRSLRREYLSLVAGVPPARSGTIDAPVGRRRDHVDRLRGAQAGEDPLRADRVVRGLRLLRVVLDTGRTHQIRVHMAAIGHPVCGDPVRSSGPARAAAAVSPRRAPRIPASGDG